MGLLDWIYRQFKRTSPDDLDLEEEAAPLDPEDVPVAMPDPLPPPASTAPAKPRRDKKKRKKAPPKEPAAEKKAATPRSPDPDRPRKKKRKQPRGDPRFHKAPEPTPAPPTEPTAPPVMVAPPPPPVPQPQLQPEPKPEPKPKPERMIAVAEAEPAPEPEERSSGMVSSDEDTLAWIVVPKLEALLAEADAALAEPEAEREALRRARKHLELEWRRLLPLPPPHAEALSAGLDARLAALAGRISAAPDPRAVEEQENLAAREALLAEAAALVQLPDLHAALEQARALQQTWKSAGRIPRAAMDDVHGRWKATMDAIYARRDAERSERLVRLEGLVNQAELLTRNPSAERAADAMKGLQQRWKATGGVRGEEADALWTRFRAAADQIFARRRAAMEEEQLQNQRAREALIAHALELAEAGVEDAEETVDQLHRRWRRIGRVPREQADALWTAFREACERLHRPPPADPELLSSAEDALQFSPFAVLGDLPAEDGIGSEGREEP